MTDEGEKHSDAEHFQRTLTADDVCLARLTARLVCSWLPFRFVELGVLRKHISHIAPSSDRSEVVAGGLDRRRNPCCIGPRVNIHPPGGNIDLDRRGLVHGFHSSLDSRGASTAAHLRHIQAQHRHLHCWSGCECGASQYWKVKGSRHPIIGGRLGARKDLTFP